MKIILGRKAQGAMEYLMTYSWAILVVMLVGIALWQLGVFDLGASRTATFTGFPTIRPHMGLSGVTSAGTLTLVLLNGGGGTIDPIPGLTVTSEDSSIDCGPTNVLINGEAIADDQAIPTGDNFVVTAALGGACQGTVGSQYALAVSLVYDVSIGTTTVTNKRSGGVIRASYE
ncbi:MAG: hypothetical protein V1921_00050 [Candidatus Altiarchaeota archaeon]